MYSQIFDKDQVDILDEARANNKFKIQDNQVNWYGVKRAGLSTSTIEFQVTFQVVHKLNEGESLVVLGSIDKLGSWNQPIHKMDWKSGDLWVSSSPLRTNVSHFNYKYAVFRNNYKERIGWERGVDRIADLKVLPDKSYQTQHSYGFDSNLREDLYAIEKYLEEIRENVNARQEIQKSIKYYDEWEKFEVSFTVLTPKEHQVSDVYFMGNKDHCRRVQMEKMIIPFEWMNVKYGMNIQPWECTIKFDNTEGSDCGQFKSTEEIKYYYIMKLSDGSQIVEKEPMRSCILQDPSKYKGQLGINLNTFWLNTDQVYIVNGVMYKADGNFYNNFFAKDVAGYNIKLGSQPTTPNDFDTLFRFNTEGNIKNFDIVLNIENEEDFLRRNVAKSSIIAQYNKYGKNIVNFIPIYDFDSYQYVEGLFSAAHFLNREINEKKRYVFLNCTTGISRGPTLLMCYLALFKRNQGWKNVEELSKFIKDNYNQSAKPNIRVVKKVIEKELKRIRDIIIAEQQAEKIRVDEFQRKFNEYVHIENQKDEADDRIRKQKIREELDKLERLKQKDLEDLELLRRQFAEQEAKRKQELQKILQEILLMEEKIRLLMIELQNMRDAWKLKFDKWAIEDKARLQQWQKEYEEIHCRKLRERRDFDENELLRRRQELEDIIIDLTERIRIAKLEVYEVKAERDEIDGDKELRQKLREEENELERSRRKKQAQLEIQQNLQRIKIIEEENDEKSRKEKLAQFDFQCLQAKIQSLATEEQLDVYGAKLSQLYNFNRDLKYVIQPYHQDFQAGATSYDYLEQFGISEEELDQQCEELFREVPIVFSPRKGSNIDQMIAQQMQQLHLTFPIVWIQDNLYLIGSIRLNCELKDGQPVVIVNGQKIKFSDYAKKQNQHFQRMLVIHMIKSGESLDWVVDQLINGQVIQNVNQEAFVSDNKVNGSQSSYSPNRGRRYRSGSYSETRRSSQVRGRSRVYQEYSQNDQVSQNQSPQRFGKRQ